MKEILRWAAVNIDNCLNRSRNFWAKQIFGTFGPKSIIYGRIFFSRPENIFVGKNVKINEGAVINARAPVVINDNCHISYGVVLNTGGLNLEDEPADRAHFQKEIRIGENVWVGTNAVIFPGVTIGKSSIIGAGAVVLKSVPSGEIWGGVPAKFIKKTPAFEKSKMTKV